MTALESHWGTPEDSLFLGGWCKEVERYNVWKQYNQVVLSHRWTDLGELKKGLRYCHDLSPRVIRALADFIRRAYKIDKPDRFFEKLLIPWVNMFLSHLYCRYFSIKEGCEKLDHPCFITAPEGVGYPPFDDHYQWHAEAFFSHNFNLYFFSDIVHVLNLPHEARAASAELVWNYKKPEYSLKKRMLLFGQYFINTLFQRDFYVVGNMYAFSTKLALERVSKGKIVCDLFLDWPKVDINPDAELRKKQIDVGDDEFCQMAGQLVLKYIPKGLLEGVPIFLELAQRHPARKAKSFFTTLDNYYNLPWLYVLAYSGAPVGMLAHGGYSSVYAENIFNQTEKQWADRIFDSGSGAHPLPNLSLYRLTEDLSSKATPATPKSLLILGDARGGYDRLAGLSPLKDKPYDSIPLKEYRFFELLLPEISVEYRHFLKPESMSCFEPITCFHKKITFHAMKDKPFYQAVHEAKLVCNINANWSSLTTYELLCANKPCVIVYEDPPVPVTGKMMNVMGVLSKAGIVHFKSEDAARHINNIFGVVDEWWQSAAVQNARKIFIDEFAKHIDNWPQKYFAAVQELAKDFKGEDVVGMKV